jgi:hypothetical protein
VENYKRHRAIQRITDRDRTAYREGCEAKRARASIGQNPYERGTTAHREWSRGYRATRPDESNP